MTAASEGPSVEGNGFLCEQADLIGLSWALRSDPGMLRAGNEDFAAACMLDGPVVRDLPAALFVVADGLGGHAAGEVASRLAVDTVVEHFRRTQARPSRQALRTAVRAANAALLDASGTSERHGMATTLTAMAIAGHQAVIAHVGDSRAYLLRKGEVVQLTSDHSQVGEMLRRGLLSPDQAARHPARSVLTRCLGRELVVPVDLTTVDTADGDIFLICTDGLWDLVGRDEISALAEESELAADRLATSVLAEELVRKALERGAPDNVTAVVVKLRTGCPPAKPGAAKDRSGRLSVARWVRRSNK